MTESERRIQQGRYEERNRIEKILAPRLMVAARAYEDACDRSKTAEASRELTGANARYDEALEAYQAVFLSTPGDLKLYSAPVWCGARKLGTSVCGYCGSAEHGWTVCRSEKADPVQQARAIACGEEV